MVRWGLGIGAALGVGYLLFAPKSAMAAGTLTVTAVEADSAYPDPYVQFNGILTNMATAAHFTSSSSLPPGYYMVGRATLSDGSSSLVMLPFSNAGIQPGSTIDAAIVAMLKSLMGAMILVYQAAWIHHSVSDIRKSGTIFAGDLAGLPTWLLVSSSTVPNTRR
jgi:hypothetical protein